MTSDAAPRIGQVPLVAWDHVYMQMGNGLPRGHAHIDTDVVSRWVVKLVNGVSDRGYHADKCLMLGCRGIERVGHMPKWDDQCVTLGYRKGIPHCHDTVIPKEHPRRIRGAKGAAGSVTIPHLVSSPHGRSSSRHVAPHQGIRRSANWAQADERCARCGIPDIGARIGWCCWSVKMWTSS